MILDKILPRLKMNKTAKTILGIALAFLLVLILTLTIFSMVAGGDEPSQESILWKRTATTNIYKNPDGSYTRTIGQGVINYDDDSRRFPNYVPINTTLIQNQTELYGITYDYYRDLNLYQAYFKEKSGTTTPWTRPVAVVKDGYMITLAPTSLKFTGQTNAHIQQSTATTENNIVTYPNQFKNIDLRYNYGNTQLKEELIIDSLSDLQDIKTSPLLTDDLILKFKVRSYNIDSNISMNMKINNQKVNFDNIIETQTNDAIYFLDENNETVYYFKKPIAYDSNSGQINLDYSIESNLFGNLVVKVFTPYEWLQNAVYPVYIDPTITLLPNDIPRIKGWTEAEDKDSSLPPFWTWENLNRVVYTVSDKNDLSDGTGVESEDTFLHNYGRMGHRIKYNISSISDNNFINSFKIDSLVYLYLNLIDDTMSLYIGNQSASEWNQINTVSTDELTSFQNTINTNLDDYIQDEIIFILFDSTYYFDGNAYNHLVLKQLNLTIDYTPYIDILSPTPSQQSNNRI